MKDKEIRIFEHNLAKDEYVKEIAFSFFMNTKFEFEFLFLVCRLKQSKRDGNL